MPCNLQERSSMHFYLRPSVESYAEAMLAVLDQKNMKQFTVISDNSPTGGALVRRIREITDNDPSWVLNDVVMFSKDEITAIELYKVLQKVKETKVIILQSSLSDAVRIFNIAGWLRMTGIRYTWVVSEHVVIPLRTKINKYPKNILAVKSPGRDPWVSVIHDAVHLGAAAVVEAKLEHRELPALQPDCWSNSVHNPGGELVQRYGIIRLFSFWFKVRIGYDICPSALIHGIRHLKREKSLNLPVTTSARILLVIFSDLVCMTQIHRISVNLYDHFGK